MHGRSLYPIHVLLNLTNEIASQKTMNKTYAKPFDRTFIGLFKKCEPPSYNYSQPTNQPTRLGLNEFFLVVFHCIDPPKSSQNFVEKAHYPDATPLKISIRTHSIQAWLKNIKIRNS